MQFNLKILNILKYEKFSKFSFFCLMNLRKYVKEISYLKNFIFIFILMLSGHSLLAGWFDDSNKQPSQLTLIQKARAKQYLGSLDEEELKIQYNLVNLNETKDSKKNTTNVD